MSIFFYISSMDFGQFGRTWWSKKWLEAILAQADTNAITTGMRYATRGQVTNLDIVDNRILSVIKGPNGGLHNNYIVFPKFSTEKCVLFANLLRQQPAETIALNNKSLCSSIEILLNKSNLKLFDNPDTIKMGCDCRDLPPCKYIIATFFKIAELADSDPNILFKIHGLDLNLYKNMQASQLELEAPTEFSLIRTIGKECNIKNNNFIHIDEFNFEKNNEFLKEDTEVKKQESCRIPPKQLPKFNFEEWKDYSRMLPAMLQNFPNFCPAGNFRKSFIDELDGIHKFFCDYENFTIFSEHFRAYNAKTFLMENEFLRVFHKNGWHWIFEQSNNEKVLKKDLTATSIMGALCCLSEGNFSWHHYTIRYLHLILKTAFYLVRTGAIYPQVFWISKDVAQIRWLPAEMLPDILSIVADLEVAAPKNFAYTIKDEKYLILAEPAEHILSQFIAQLLHFARTYKAPLKTNHSNLLAFFFDCISGKLANNAHAIPGKIQQWFSVYSSLDFRSQIQFFCYESNEYVALEVFLIDENKDNSPQTSKTALSVLFENNDSRLLSILNILKGVADFFPPMNKYLENRATNPILMRGTDLLEFLQDCLKKLEVFGIHTEIPSNLLKIEKPKTIMRLQGNMNFNAFSANDLLDFDWEVAIGDENISADEFLKLAEKADGLLKYKSQYIQVTEKDLQDLRERLNKKSYQENKGNNNPKKEENVKKNIPQITQSKLMQACFTGECDNIPVEMAGKFKHQFELWRAETEIPIPNGLNATLRPYQLRGYSWMYKNLEIGFGCILADDMGMGKTLQVIAFLLKMMQESKLDERKAIVVMPAGLLFNWQMEIKKFAPQLTTFAYHGGNRNLNQFNSHVLLTTYATFRKDYDILNKNNWQVIVIDEAQNIKNADSEQSRLIRKLHAPMKIAMSGTPVENRLMEFWTIMDFVNHDFFPSAAEFREKFETPIQKNNNKTVAENFKKITAPFMLRRLKTDKSIISDLPDKIIQDEYAELTCSQAALYKRTLDYFMEQLELEQALSDKLNDKHAIFKRKGIILQMILALKQICNHPKTFLKGNENAPIDDSGKMQLLFATLRSIQEQGEKTLIFTQFAEMGEILKQSIKNELGLNAHFYHGGCSQNKRNEIIKDFQENSESKILILSLKAGGTGLNLTAASQVIHYDLWWNPAIESQATDRAFRIGQTRNVQVHRFITKGTFEEKINKLLESKKAIAEMTVSAGETWLADMDDKQLSEVFGLDNTLT